MRTCALLSNLDKRDLGRLVGKGLNLNWEKLFSKNLLKWEEEEKSFVAKLIGVDSKLV